MTKLVCGNNRKCDDGIMRIGEQKKISAGKVKIKERRQKIFRR